MKMWEIRENTGRYDEDYRIGYKKKSMDEAYECGYEDGYATAMKEVKGEESETSYRKRRY